MIFEHEKREREDNKEEYEGNRRTIRRNMTEKEGLEKRPNIERGGDARRHDPSCSTLEFVLALRWTCWSVSPASSSRATRG